MDKLLSVFESSKIIETDKVNGGGLFQWLYDWGHEAGMTSECINYGECGETTVQHDYDDGSSHTHTDS